MSDRSWTKTDYRFVQPIAEGGMGCVDMVVRRSEHFQRVYAMKRLKPAARDDASHRAMFLDEARLCGLLRHPNVVSVLDVGEDADGPYMVMEFISGVTAAQLLRRYSEQNELPGVQLCVRIALDVAQGLAAAHGLKGQNGQLLEVVHRDLSPQNVLIGFDGRARLSDFGVARAKGRETKTETGVLKGKLAYMAPEQVRFEPASRQSDIFAFGVVLYELLSARRLYQGSHAEVAKQILSGPPPDIADVRSDVHPSLVALLFQLLAKDADDRPQTADNVVEVLQAILEEEVAAEGVASMSLADSFGEEREQQEAAISKALSLEAEEFETPSSSRRSKLAALVVFAAATAAAAALTSFAWNDSGPEAQVERADTVAPPRFTAPVPAEPAQEVSEGDPAEQPAGDEDVVPVPPVGSDERRRTRRTRRGMRASMSAPMVSPQMSMGSMTGSTAVKLRDFGSTL